MPLSAAAQATLMADAHVSSARPTVNAGTLTNLNVGGGYTALVQFDLSLLPAGTTAAQVTRAVLRVYCNRADTPGLVALQPVGGTWGEYSVTYATLPALGAAVQTAQVGAADTFVTFDVTATVQGWIAAPANNNGLALTAGTAVVQFDSKENDQTAHAPELQIVLAAGGAGTQGPVGPAGPQGIQGMAGVQGLVGAQGPAGPQGVPGVAGAKGATGAAGAAGPVGPVGPVGPQGPSGNGGGPAGPAGPQGPPGAVGAPGTPGTPGLVYQGSYVSTANYALGDVVLFAGSSYASLVASNQGQTPGASPAFWGALTAQGPQGVQGAAGVAGPTGASGPPGSVGPPGQTGAQGLQGAAGQAGAQGLTGAAGAQGLQGPAGPVGAAGPVGLAFRGAYDATVNYALADGVLFQGTGYVSLAGGNHGNTPDQSPQFWSAFATGSPGAAGAVGAPGPVGPPGAQGPAGFDGAVGPRGLAGPVGPAGVNYMGNYSSVNSYSVADAVSFGGSTYVSLVGNNHGQTPDQSPAFWAVLAAQGVAGPTGVAGPQGAVGLAGATGPAGPQGSQGPPVNFAGVWSAGQAYAVGNAVSFGGASYIALAASAGQQPDVNPAVWGVLSAQGSPGPTGAQGLSGAPGVPGPPGPVGPQGVAGQAGAQGLTGAPGAQGPQGSSGPQGVAGAQGVAGQTGPAGAVGMNFRGAWNQTASYALNDAVTFAGSTFLAQTANQNQEPDIAPQIWAVVAQAGGAGPTGAAGSPGAAASVAVGSVTTLAAGSTATVTNSGTTGAVVLNFGIPQGAAGSGGGTASGGVVAGASFAAIYHTVSFSTAFYAVNAASASASESAAVLAWVPRGCSAVRLDVFSQQSNTVTVTLRNGLPGALADTALSCAVASGASCTATGAVAVAAGSFIDLAVSGASGTPAGVWTSLECD